MSPEKMVNMANQIAGFFNTQPDIDPAESVAKHLRDFWAPPMRAQLLAYVRDGGAGLNETALRASRMIG